MDSGLLSEGGTILFDNALFRGNPYLEETTEESNPMGWGIKKCNEFVAADPRVRCVSCLNKIFERKIVNIFLLISFNICFGCSKEPSQ